MEHSKITKYTNISKQILKLFNNININKEEIIPENIEEILSSEEEYNEERKKNQIILNEEEEEEEEEFENDEYNDEYINEDSYVEEEIDNNIQDTLNEEIENSDDNIFTIINTGNEQENFNALKLKKNKEENSKILELDNIDQDKVDYIIKNRKGMTRERYFKIIPKKVLGFYGNIPCIITRGTLREGELEETNCVRVKGEPFYGISDEQLLSIKIMWYNLMEVSNPNKYGHFIETVMGAGKTVVSVVFLLYCYRYKILKKSILILPKPVIGQWIKELLKWSIITGIYDINYKYTNKKFIYLLGMETPSKPTNENKEIQDWYILESEMFKTIKGKKKQNINNWNKDEKGILITNSDQLLKINDIEMNMLQKTDIVIIDEASDFKNEFNNLNKGLGKTKILSLFLESEKKDIFKVLLTATPIDNRITEYISLNKFIMPDKVFEKIYLTYDEKDRIFGEASINKLYENKEYAEFYNLLAYIFRTAQNFVYRGNPNLVKENLERNGVIKYEYSLFLYSSKKLSEIMKYMEIGPQHGFGIQTAFRTSTHPDYVLSYENLKILKEDYKEKLDKAQRSRNNEGRIQIANFEKALGWIKKYEDYRKYFKYKENTLEYSTKMKVLIEITEYIVNKTNDKLIIFTELPEKTIPLINYYLNELDEKEFEQKNKKEYDLYKKEEIILNKEYKKLNDKYEELNKEDEDESKEEKKEKKRKKAEINKKLKNQKEKLEKLKKENDFKYMALELTGKTKSKDAIISEFKELKNRIIIIGIKAGGVGINIAFANRIILLEVNNNPSIEFQAIARGFRTGQKKNVHVYRLIDCGINENIFENNQEKETYFKSFKDDTDRESEDERKFNTNIYKNIIFNGAINNKFLKVNDNLTEYSTFIKENNDRLLPFIYKNNSSYIREIKNMDEVLIEYKNLEIKNFKDIDEISIFLSKNNRVSVSTPTESTLKSPYFNKPYISSGFNFD